MNIRVAVVQISIEKFENVGFLKVSWTLMLVLVVMTMVARNIRWDSKQGERQPRRNKWDSIWWINLF